MKKTPIKKVPLKRKRKRGRSAQQMEKDLRVIYSNRDGKIPDLTRLDHKKKSRVTTFLIKLIVLLLGLSIVAWISFFVMQPFSINTNSLTFDIETPNEIVAGEEVSFSVEYKNETNVPIASLEIQLNLPETFLIRNMQPEPSKEMTWTIGSLSSGSDGSIEITGIFTSAVNTKETLQTVFTYRPANFNSDFQEIKNVPVEITDSVLQIDVTGPEKTLPGDEVTYQVDVQNKGKTRAEAFEIRLLLPEMFSTASTDPESDSEDRVAWQIGAIEPDELMSLTLVGSYTNDASGTLPVTAQVGFLNKEKTFYTQDEKMIQTDILGGNLVFHLIVNGSSETQTASLGESLRVSIDYENRGNETMKGIAFVLDGSAETGYVPLEWSKGDLEGGDIETNRITWDETVIESLAILEPGDSGVIDLVIPLIDEVDPSAADAFTIELTTLIDQVGDIRNPRSIASSPINIQIKSDTEFIAEARYFDDSGDKIGTGPIPPRVNQSTVYRVFWTVNNSLHDLENISITGNLPPDVRWTSTSSSDIGTLVYNETTRMAQWKIEQLPKEINTVTGWFDLSITPDEGDKGAFFKLMNATSFQATDSITNTTIQKSLGILDTDLSEDSFASGSGVVVE